MSYINFRESVIEATVNGTYKDGLGNTKKMPSNSFDKEAVIKAICKRMRKAERNKKLLGG